MLAAFRRDAALFPNYFWQTCYLYTVVGLLKKSLADETSKSIPDNKSVSKSISWNYDQLLYGSGSIIVSATVQQIKPAQLAFSAH